MKFEHSNFPCILLGEKAKESAEESLNLKANPTTELQMFSIRILSGW